ncbi:glycosyl hydrolase [Aliikangiella marina]|uniref:Glycosyl hydrolase n=1 Tax=Aliikangiella marina TaxID=1712262 RepID=A0A545TIT3_9GAMM|nr:glycosyl hydrolase [Aliikangiella marina]TQV77123.1 glycosyl hydrolase [Aliikangiella marina]
MTNGFKWLLAIIVASSLFVTVFSSSETEAKEKGPMSSKTFDGLAFRSIGPALMSGRIADIDIDPNNRNIWYVAVGSGGVWKTINAGTTWEPLFDDQPVYSIGTITIDPNNASTIWVGTGENVSGRHVSFGDGIYVSHDAGKTWQNMGLKDSEHISEIIIHPKDSNTLWVASQGPLWSKGGQRGLYKTTDGGKTWSRVLGDDKWVGVTDVQIDPRNPDRLYAATWQRHRTVAALVDGGPGTGIHRTEDGGKTWIQLNPAKHNQKDLEKLSTNSGLPKSDMGKIGLAISPINPDVVYAAIELDRRTGAVYRSEDRGASWKKMSDAVAGGTGPHYYQELYASPHNFDEIFLANVRMLHSTDGGKTFKQMKEEHKHSDNHSLTFLPDDKGYLLMGTDGGIYESFDSGKNWRYIHNLPLTQFYKVAVDDAQPFYNVFGGTQDNGTQGGPSRTDNRNGIRNADWEMVLFGDGHQPATEPGNPDIMYGEWQQGNLMRIDRKTGELVYIQPQPAPGDPVERFNWDAPILVSPHDPKTIYHASQRVWRSENRGDSWTAISGDLTKNLERIEQPIMDGQPGWDSAWDMWAMSDYSTITSLAESPKQPGLIYAGTDDGLIQVTENGGKNWRKMEVGDLPGVPDSAFVNDIRADLFDPDTVYIALDNHKFGDYKPYLLKSTNRGKSWRSIASNLPDKHLVWRLVQDHINKDLIFAATEFGVFFTVDGGKDWIELNGGLPTIAFRDIAIQRRENDLVLASFGRSFYILDDYSALRDISADSVKQDSLLFKPRKAWWYIEQGPLSRFDKLGYQGASYYAADNPPFGATFTYYLKDKLKTNKDVRQKSEKALKEKGKPIPFPGWEAVETERRQRDPKIWLTVRNGDNKVVRRIEGINKAGINRVSWGLDLPPSDVIDKPKAEESNAYIQFGLLAAPGEYSVSLEKEVDGEVTQLQSPVSFMVEPMTQGALKGAAPEKVAEFWLELHAVSRDSNATHYALNQAIERVKMLYRAISESQSAPGDLEQQLHAIRAELLDINHILNDDQSRGEVYLSNRKTVENLIGVAMLGTAFSTYGPTATHRQSLDRAKRALGEQNDRLKKIVNERIPALEAALRELGAPWIKGQALP